MYLWVCVGVSEDSDKGNIDFMVLYIYFLTKTCSRELLLWVKTAAPLPFDAHRSDPDTTPS